jgi:hypothetical protein
MRLLKNPIFFADASAYLVVDMLGSQLALLTSFLGRIFFPVRTDRLDARMDGYGIRVDPGFHLQRQGFGNACNRLSGRYVWAAHRFSVKRLSGVWRGFANFDAAGESKSEHQKCGSEDSAEQSG